VAVDEAGRATDPEGGAPEAKRVGGRRRRRVLVAAAAWAVLALVAWWWASGHDDGVAGAMADLLGAAETPAGAFGVLLVAFALRPLTLLPSTVLTAFAGFLLGPVLGLVVATVAVTSTSLVPYAATRVMRGAALQPPRAGWRSDLARRPFAAVLAARLMMLPGDLVNAAAGVLRVPLLPFVGATLLGGTPGLLVGVLAGASLRGSRFEPGALQFDPWLLAAAVGVSVVSLGLAAIVRRRSGSTSPPGDVAATLDDGAEAST
jgi:uncharacterized membrane protein YdjX (TVP38/TMEM64 family)